MSYESWRARLLAEGGSIKGSVKNTTKIVQNQRIINSPTRSDVILNNNDDELYPCIVSDIDTYEIRSFLFLPDVVVFKGDYIQHDGFTYLIIGHNIKEEYPKAIGRLCNYDYPVKIETIKIRIGTLSNGRPDYKTIETIITKPTVMTAKIYSIADNSSIPLPDGAMTVYIPYVKDEIELPPLNEKITVRQSQYKVTDLIFENVLVFNGEEKGYVELRLQREANSNG